MSNFICNRSDRFNVSIELPRGKINLAPNTCFALEPGEENSKSLSVKIQGTPYIVLSKNPEGIELKGFQESAKTSLKNDSNIQSSVTDQLINELREENRLLKKENDELKSKTPDAPPLPDELINSLHSIVPMIPKLSDHLGKIYESLEGLHKKFDKPVDKKQDLPKIESKPPK